MKLTALALLAALPAAAQVTDLSAAFSQLSAAAKHARPAKPSPAAKPTQASTDVDYAEVAKAYQALTNKFAAAELTIHGGTWALELKAGPGGVSYWPGGYSPSGKGTKAARLVFTQEILERENPYVHGTPVFTVQEEAMPVAEHHWFDGDPKSVALASSEPGKFATSQPGRWMGKREKAYDCRAKDDDHMLCKVNVTLETFTISRATFYLGFARKKTP